MMKESVGSAKLLAGFAPHVTSAGIAVNGKTALRQRKCAKLAVSSRNKRKYGLTCPQFGEVHRPHQVGSCR